MMSAFNEYADNIRELRTNPKSAIKLTSNTGENHSPDGGQPLDSGVSTAALQSPSSLMPVSELQELCAKSGRKNPEYRLFRTEGNSHSPIFTIKCFLNDVEIGEGLAKSKKEAKHNAARKALIAIREQKIAINSKTADPSVDLNKLRINDSDYGDSSSSVADGVSTDSHSPEVNGSADSQRNAVSVLQELCAKNCFNAPDYRLSDQIGSCHEPVFTFSCEVEVCGEKIVGKASGKTKQTAKRASAEEALRLIKEKDIPLYATNNIKKKTRNNAINNNSNYEQQRAYKETLDLMENLQARPDLDHLLEQAQGTDVDFVFRFNLIAEKLGCFANYIPFLEEGSPKKYKCLLQMRRNQSQTLYKRLPIFVSWGNSGQSEQHAMQLAAQKAIIMVKVLKM